MLLVLSRSDPVKFPVESALVNINAWFAMGCILAEMLSIASKMCEDYQSKGFSARASAAGFLV